ncbi:hypothetical protein Hanom_Chr16g01452661 [Helianthus anomalus]
MPLLMNHIIWHNNHIRITDMGVKFLTCNKIIRIYTEDRLMSLQTHHCMMIINPLTRAIRFKLSRYRINICIIVKILLISLLLLIYVLLL